MCIGLRVKYQLFLSDFNEFSIFSIDFRKKKFKRQISLSIHPARADLFHEDGQTDMTKLMVTFRNYVEAGQMWEISRLSESRSGFWESLCFVEQISQIYGCFETSTSIYRAKCRNILDSFKIYRC